LIKSQPPLDALWQLFVPQIWKISITSYLTLFNAWKLVKAQLKKLDVVGLHAYLLTQCPGVRTTVSWDERAAAEGRAVHPDLYLVLKLALDGIFATNDAAAVPLWIANYIMVFVGSGYYYKKLQHTILKWFVICGIKYKSETNRNTRINQERERQPRGPSCWKTNRLVTNLAEFSIAVLSFLMRGDISSRSTQRALCCCIYSLAKIKIN
jgi:hypothetical protein